MNILMMSLLYPEDQLDEVNHNAKDKLQNQINNYQRAFMEGIEANLQAGERLDLLNSLPVGIFPIQYCQLFLCTIKKNHQAFLEYANYQSHSDCSGSDNT